MKITSFFIGALLTVILTWILGWLLFATSIAVAQPETGTEKTSAIVVLTGGNGRINEGLNLLDENKASKLFVSGVHEKTTKDDIYNSWKKPVDERRSKKGPCCLHLGYEATDTYSNAQETKEWVDEKNIKSIRLVTSSYHMPRANLLMKRFLPDTNIIQHPVFSDDFQPWKGRFWPLTFSEYNKWLATKVMPDFRE
ncbi:MAG: YdcF family protein [Pseudomonadota bacterium]